MNKFSDAVAPANEMCGFCAGYSAYRWNNYEGLWACQECYEGEIEASGAERNIYADFQEPDNENNIISCCSLGHFTKDEAIACGRKNHPSSWLCQGVYTI